jgi:1-acyl-sn-glycerol-3-phosphate acyltransferase
LSDSNYFFLGLLSSRCRASGQWKQLEDNPITKLLFRQCGFIPVQMSANKAGEDNDYDLKSFKALLKSTKKAFEEGFDIGILPEGQLNPEPEKGLLPCFPGAFTLARMSRRPIHMMALHGTHRLWHAKEEIGMTVTGRDVELKVYPGGRKFASSEEFLETFNAVVGQFASKGTDFEEAELQAWLDGSEWEKRKSQEAEKE